MKYHLLKINNATIAKTKTIASNPGDLGVE